MEKPDFFNEGKRGPALSILPQTIETAAGA
jgi:hypothetical protein